MIPYIIIFPSPQQAFIIKTKDLKSFVLNNAISYEINQKKIAFNSGASWIYGIQNKELSNNDFSATANLDYLKDVQRFYYWGLVNYDESYSLKINYRFQSGLGVGYAFVKEKNFDFELSDGFLFETSHLVDQVAGREVYETTRNSLRLRTVGLITKLSALKASIFIGLQ